VLGLVAAEEAGRLDLGGGAARELFVEVDHPLHPDSIGSRSDCLRTILSDSILIACIAYRISARALARVSLFSSRGPLGHFNH
jgi:hypothetical protein